MPPWGCPSPKRLTGWPCPGSRCLGCSTARLGSVPTSRSGWNGPGQVLPRRGLRCRPTMTFGKHFSMSSRQSGLWPPWLTFTNHRDTRQSKRAALGAALLLWMNGVLDWGVQSHRLRRRGRPSDFVSVPRTPTGALKAPAARAAAGPLKPPHTTHPPGAVISLIFWGFPRAELFSFVLQQTALKRQRPRGQRVCPECSRIHSADS
ncbi:hypothetical protein LMG26684_05075 [Achromobacter mucicolens]|nr:hypothetical protein LMG26684_05075 [Achromobacter mucicolens]